MAVPWLDLVRYADTVGFHGDQNQNAWLYRDYVIESFNRNKPFDQFTIEQIAGDLLPAATPETRTATCFNRLNMMTREGGAQPGEYLARYAADRVRTIGMTWLGSTLGCCECHDHKYDPFSTKDFYSLSAFFADIQQWGVYADYGYTPNPDLRGYTNDHPFPPEIRVASSYLKQRMQRLRARMTQTAQESSGALNRGEFEAWIRAGATFLAGHSDGWQALQPERLSSSNSTGGEAVGRLQADGSILLDAGASGDLTITLQPDLERIAALCVELLPHAQHGGSVLQKGGAPGLLTLTASVLSAPRPRPLTFHFACARLAEPRYSNGFELPGVQRGWKLSGAHLHEPLRSIWTLAAPLRCKPGEQISVTFKGIRPGCVRIAASPFAPEDFENLAAADLKTWLEKPRTDLAASRLQLAYLLSTAWNQECFARLRALQDELAGCRGGESPVLTTVAIAPAVTRVLPRGNWQDTSGETVLPAVPHFLPQPKEAGGRRLTRLDLAKWLISARNPLTARTFVNRLWKQFFGMGLCDTVDDLGAQGEWPANPELLDWLAVEFREKGWDVKRMVRLLVTSSAYRQSSRLRPEVRAIDPGNRLLSSQNPRRLDAEFIRDNALTIAGLLNRDVGGPPCKPYQPEGYYINIQFPNRSYTADGDERQWRRGLYMHWQRTFLHPMLANFGAPSREDCVAARTAANTPQQALTLLNDPCFVEAARVFAARLLTSDAVNDRERLRRAFQLALMRPPSLREEQSLLPFLQKMRGVYRSSPEEAKRLLAVGISQVSTAADPVELAAWINVCRVILNLHETITRY